MSTAIQAMVCHIEHSNEALLIGSNQWPSVPRMLLNWLLPSIHRGNWSIRRGYRRNILRICRSFLHGIIKRKIDEIIIAVHQKIRHICVPFNRNTATSSAMADFSCAFSCHSSTTASYSSSTTASYSSRSTAYAALFHDLFGWRRKRFFLQQHFKRNASTFNHVL
jgi:hypothetical protein